MSRLVALAVCTALLSSSIASPVLAVEAAKPDAIPVVTEKSLDCAGRYMKALDMKKTMLALMSGMMPAVMAQAPASEQVEATVKAKILEAINEGILVVLPQMLEEMTPALAVHFTEAEVCAMADFYDSPTGRSIISKMPAYTQETSAVSAKFIPLMQQEMLTRLCQKIDCGDRSAKTPARSDS